MARLLVPRGFVLSPVSTLPSTLMKDKTSGSRQKGQVTQCHKVKAKVKLRPSYTMP